MNPREEFQKDLTTQFEAFRASLKPFDTSTYDTLIETASNPERTAKVLQLKTDAEARDRTWKDKLLTETHELVVETPLRVWDQTFVVLMRDTLDEDGKIKPDQLIGYLATLTASLHLLAESASKLKEWNNDEART